MEWIQGFIPEWLMGLLIPLLSTGALGLVAALSKRYKFGLRMWKLGGYLRKIGFACDIPIVGGDSEVKMKEKLFSTFSDGIRCLARGLAGQSFEDK